MGEAIELTSRLYPGLLERDPNLLFALKCRQFVEMVNGSDSEVTQSSNVNQTSVIQSTKAYTKSSTNGNVEEMNMNNTMNGSTEQQLVNGQIDNDVDMEENVVNGVKSTATENGYQNGDLNTNGYKCQNGEDVDMGETILFLLLSVIISSGWQLDTSANRNSSPEETSTGAFSSSFNLSQLM